MEVVITPQEPTIENLQTELAATKTELATTKAALDSALAVNAELSKEIESLSTKAESNSAEPVFEVEGQFFGFHFHKAVFLGQAITHTDVLNDADLQKKLVEAGSGMIKAK
jgi:hypothetical protein